MIYIYGLKCPLLGVIRYVGKSEKPQVRFIRHIRSAVRGDYNHRTARWLRKLHRLGMRPELVILHSVRPHERWQDVERQFIRTASQRGWNLTNSTAGGEGLEYTDPVAKARYIANLSAANKKVWSTPEGREAARKRVLAAWADPEITARRLASIKAAYTRPDVKAKLAAAKDEINSRPEVIEKRRQSIEKRRRHLQEAINRPITRARMSGSAKRRWDDPERRAELIAIRSTPESKARLKASAIMRSTAEYRAMMAEKTRASWVKRRAAKYAE